MFVISLAVTKIKLFHETFLQLHNSLLSDTCVQ